ncbi:Alanine--glyoxylate aminotransferase 2 1, mitochondrial [Nymphon striatum]|nr:Alanine--glyoxylate aminotransferase 2 1, mitochondrial [Nymphon striatum]
MLMQKNLTLPFPIKQKILGNTSPLHTDWSIDETARRRNKFYAASQSKFVPFKDPIVFKKGSMQYLWDADGNKYIDLLGMNVCISVGHSHPKKNLQLTMPKGPKGDIEWVVHFTNSGSEAIDLAMTMARTYTGNLDLLALRTAYHGPTASAQSITGIAGWRHPGMPGNVAFVAEPNQYRGIFGPVTDPYLDEIESTIASATTGKIAGMFVESVQGYGGIIEMPPVLQVIREDKVQENAKVVGAALLERLKDLQRKYPVIGDVRGRGLMLAIEMVKDQKTKEPDEETTSAVFEKCREQRLILSKSGPTRSCLRMVPPMCLTLEDVEKVAEGLSNAFSSL